MNLMQLLKGNPLLLRFGNEITGGNHREKKGGYASWHISSELSGNLIMLLVYNQISHLTVARSVCVN